MDFSWFSLCVSVALLLLVGMLSLYLYGTYNNSYWKSRGVPHVKPLTFLCYAVDMLLGRKNFAQVFHKLHDDLKPHDFGGFCQFSQPVLMIRGPDLIRQVLVKDFRHFHDRPPMYDEKEEPLTANLMSLEGNRWKDLHVKLSPAFSSGKMKQMFGLMTECGEELRDYLKETADNEREVEIKEVLAKFSTDVIGSCAFGLELNAMKDPDSEFRKMGRKILSSSVLVNLERVCVLLLPRLAKLFKWKIIRQDISDFFIKTVGETVAYREKNNVQRNDFMDLLIQIKNEGVIKEDDDNQEDNSNNQDNMDNDTKDQGVGQETMTIEQMAAQAFVFFVAGCEASSTLMSFCLYELTLNPQIQDTLREEIQGAIDKNGGELTYEAVNKMEYLDKVFSETLRKYSAGAMLMRHCTEPYKIPNTNVLVEKGTPILISVNGIHYDPKYYPDPEKFIPERFDEEERRKRPSYTFMPFGEGPRVCIGKRYALMQAKVGIAMVLTRYSVSVGEKTPIPLVIEPRSMMIAAKGGMWLKIKHLQ